MKPRVAVVSRDRSVKPAVKPIALAVLVATAHVLFLAGSYGRGFWGLGHVLSPVVAVALWLGGSSALAGWAYFKVAARLLRAPWAKWLLSAVMTLGSMYLGVFLAFNLFGT